MLPADWTPIASINYFNGTFDGNGHSITYASGAANPLFDYLYTGGVIKNLTVKVDTMSQTYSTTGIAYFGAVAKKNWGGTIENCSVVAAEGGAGTITLTNSNSSGYGYAYFGGITGYNYSGGVVKNCSVGTAAAPISLECNFPNSEKSMTDGVVGYSSGSSTQIILDDTCSLYVTLSSQTGYVGGMVGALKNGTVSYGALANDIRLLDLGTDVLGADGVTGSNDSGTVTVTNENAVLNVTKNQTA